MAVVRRQLVVLEDSLLRAISGDQRFITEFPFLAGLREKAKQGCGRCGRRAAQTAPQQTLDAAKRTLAGMARDKKKTLLRLLNAKVVRLRYQDGARSVVLNIEDKGEEGA